MEEDIKKELIRQQIGVMLMSAILLVSGFILLSQDTNPVTYSEGPKNIATTNVSAAKANTSNTTVEKVKTKININTASIEDLDTLPGIGEVTAQKIIDYRTNTSLFKTPADIMEVPGIGDAKYGALKDLISI